MSEQSVFLNLFAVADFCFGMPRRTGKSESGAYIIMVVHKEHSSPLPCLLRLILVATRSRKFLHFRLALTLNIVATATTSGR